MNCIQCLEGIGVGSPFAYHPNPPFEGRKNKEADVQVSLPICQKCYHGIGEKRITITIDNIARELKPKSWISLIFYNKTAPLGLFCYLTSIPFFPENSSKCLFAASLRIISAIWSSIILVIKRRISLAPNSGLYTSFAIAFITLLS